MRCSALAFASLLALSCCVTNLAIAIDCKADKSNASVRCRLRHDAGTKVAVVISSDVDHLGEALDFISSWDRFPPCSNLSLDSQEAPADRHVLPALVLRLSCDWGFKKCDLAAQALASAARAHMHCFSELLLRMNIVMFRKLGSGSTVADCYEFGEGGFDSAFDDVYPCYNDTLSSAHRAQNPQGAFCPRSEVAAARHLLGADCNFLPLPNHLVSLGFGSMVYVESDNAVLKPMWLPSLLALLISDQHAWVIGSKPLDDLKVWDGVTINGGIILLNLRNNVFLSVLDEMQEPGSSSCSTTFTSSEQPISRFSCLQFRSIASFDLRLAATLRSFLSIASVHREEMVRGAVRCSELFRHAPPTLEVLDPRWHQAAFPRCIFVHKMPQMLQEFSGWDLSCSSLPAKSWLRVAGCPLVTTAVPSDSQGESLDRATASATIEAPPLGSLPNAAIDSSSPKLQRSDAEWQQLLSPLQYRVTRLRATEPAFRNLYWNNHEDGVYFSVCSNTPLFDSRDKFDSGSGWPSFTRPIEQASVGETEDVSHGMKRVEVHAAADGAHLGHVFEDGPPASGGRRYCINSASLRFVPREEYNLWVANNTLRLHTPSNSGSLPLSQDAMPRLLLPGDKHTVELPTRYSKWRRQAAPSAAVCSWRRDGFSCDYPLRSLAVVVHSCSRTHLLGMLSSMPCDVQANMSSAYTLLLPSFTDCPRSSLENVSVHIAPCFSNSVMVSVPCASHQFACTARHLLSLRLSGNIELLPRFDYIVGLPTDMIFCPFWLDQLAFYVTSSSDAIWWLGVSSLSSFPRLFDDFFILKGGDHWLLELLQQPHPDARDGHRAPPAAQLPSLLYDSMTRDAAAVAHHASYMVRPLPLVERSIHSDGSCDCAILSACISSRP